MFLLDTALHDITSRYKFSAQHIMFNSLLRSKEAVNVTPKQKNRLLNAVKSTFHNALLATSSFVKQEAARSEIVQGVKSVFSSKSEKKESRYRPGAEPYEDFFAPEVYSDVLEPSALEMKEVLNEENAVEATVKSNDNIVQFHNFRAKKAQKIHALSPEKAKKVFQTPRIGGRSTRLDFTRKEVDEMQKPFNTESLEQDVATLGYVDLVKKYLAESEDIQKRVLMNIAEWNEEFGFTGNTEADKWLVMDAVAIKKRRTAPFSEEIQKCIKEHINGPQIQLG